MNVQPAGLRRRIDDADAALAERYWQREPIERLVRDRAAFFDALLTELWRETLSQRARQNLALFAVGGYGRGELHPGSDIDLLIFCQKPESHREEIEAFVRLLFDLNLAVGHSVRSLRDCKAQVKADVTIATAMFERRRLTTPESAALQKQLQKLDAFLEHPRTWPARAFLGAKRAEQAARHRAFEDVEFGLEPNVKDAPGGLRDLQNVIWVCQRVHGAGDPERLAQKGVLTEQEADRMREGQRYLWWVRFGLHLVAGRKEERLQFDYQQELARRLGYVDTSARLGVERFMHEYYRQVLTLREVNDIVLQSLDESLAARRARVEQVNERFRLYDQSIEAVRPEVFEESPGALIELFVILAHRRDISGVRASTIRAIRRSLPLIDDQFRQDPENSRLFLALLKAPYTLVTQLTRMRRYGILGRYIPEYGEVVGQVQHDLFHIYTVDAHTMMVIRNLRMFRYRAQAERFQVAHRIVKTLPKIELLYLAGLYHDIGKGRGGDHSEIGSTFARAFCERLGLGDDDTELVCWLVEQHLLMSRTAQRRDIHDPDEIHRFACEVKSERRLDYLYALTVADIRATNPDLWDGWRASLLQDLYFNTREMLRQGLESPIDRQATIRACQERTTEQVESLGLPATEAQRVWRLLDDEFMLRHPPRLAADITAAVAQHDLANGPLVLLRNLEGSVRDAATEIFIHTLDKQNLFAACVAAINGLQLSIFDAHVHTAANGQCFNWFIVLDRARKPVRGDRAPLIERLTRAISEPCLRPPARQRLSRRHKQLKRPSEVRLQNTPGESWSRLTVNTTDRHGLLAHIGMLLVDLDLTVRQARITTLGERAEDVFHVQNSAGEPIVEPEFIYQVENAVRQTLDRMPG